MLFPKFSDTNNCSPELLSWINSSMLLVTKPLNPNWNTPRTISSNCTWPPLFTMLSSTLLLLNKLPVWTLWKTLLRTLVKSSKNSLLTTIRLVKLKLLWNLLKLFLVPLLSEQYVLESLSMNAIVSYSKLLFFHNSKQVNCQSIHV